MDKYIGRLLDNRYEILEVLGSGGMAVVYKARCHRLNRLVAIKILKDDNLQDEDFRRRFHAESQAVAMLSHPNIVSVYDVSTSVMADYIVMELIEGITLKQYMEKKGVLNWKETLHFAIQIAKALEHAHSRGIVHRDIKPHNVMVLKNGSVKVTDFGIARMMSKGNTLTKEALGSVHYISPEQAKGGRVDSRSDIYSLGAVMYEMMTGRPPYDGDSPVSVAIQHINGGAIMPSILNPNIPGGLEQIIMKAMAHEVENRYASAAQMLTDMDEFRKDPTILFDYNAPALDAVLHLKKPADPEQMDAAIEQKPERRRRRTQEENTEPEKSSKKKPAGAVPLKKNAPKKNAPKQKPEQYRDYDEEEESGRSRASVIAIIACFAAVLVAIAIILVIVFNNGMVRSNLVTVPDLIGEIYEEIVDDYPDLKIIKDEVYNDVFKAGTIINQSEPDGEKVSKGKTIVVTVSKGPAPGKVYMPNVERRTEEAAKAELDRLSITLNIVVETEISNSTVKGAVIRTVPTKNSLLTEGQTVTLYISSGPQEKDGTVPANIIGMTQTVAEMLLNGQNLYLDIVIEEAFDSNAAIGQVLRSDPAPGSPINTGDTVTLYVSKGPDWQIAISVVGLQYNLAVDTLIQAGFARPEYQMIDSDQPEGTVVDQSVEPETEVDALIPYVLYISNGQGSSSHVTKDVVIDLRGYAAEAECKVKVMLGNNVVYEETVAQGTTSITLESQRGLGEKYYKVYIGDSESPAFVEIVNF